MKKAILKNLGGFMIVAIVGSPAIAESQVVSYVDPTGKVVFTNSVDNGSSTTSLAPQQIAGPAMNDPIHGLIESIARNYGVDPALVRAMIKTESNFNRWAVSSKGALGLMQLIPNTGARFGVRDFFDPQQNIEGGVRYIKFLLEKFKGN